MPRIRLEIERAFPGYPGYAKMKNSARDRAGFKRNLISFHETREEALEEIATMRSVAFSDAITFKEARLYDVDAFNADPLKAVPLETIKPEAAS